MGTVVTGLIVALTSTLSPADAGPDTPAVAVMSVLAGSIAAALAAKGASTQAIILNVLVGISVSTLFTGFLLFGLGALRLGQWLRFIPYPVIAGFLAASGWLLITGGVEVVTQSNLTLAPASWALLYSSTYGPQILVGLVFAVAIVFLRRLVPAYLALPVAFVGFLVIVNIVLFGFIHVEADRRRAVVGELLDEVGERRARPRPLSDPLQRLLVDIDDAQRQPGIEVARVDLLVGVKHHRAQSRHRARVPDPQSERACNHGPYDKGVEETRTHLCQKPRGTCIRRNAPVPALRLGLVDGVHPLQCQLRIGGQAIARFLPGKAALNGRAE